MGVMRSRPRRMPRTIKVGWKAEVAESWVAVVWTAEA